MLQLHRRHEGRLGLPTRPPAAHTRLPPGSTWVCFSDQTAHAAMSGQYMMEQTLHLPAKYQCNPQASPLAILSGSLGAA